MIGDIDAEEAYDATDPVVVRLVVLERIADQLELPEADDGRLAARVNDALRVAGVLRTTRGVDQHRLRTVRRRLEALR